MYQKKKKGKKKINIWCKKQKSHGPRSNAKLLAHTNKLNKERKQKQNLNY